MKPPEFLNVDLEIESKSSLRSLAREFGERVMVMFSGRMNGQHCLFVEISGDSKSLERILNALCAIIEGLSANSKRVWDMADRKEFDLGFEARLSSLRANRFTIRPSTLRRVAKLGASLAVTFYREDRAEADGAAPNGSQRVRSEAKTTSSASRSRRSHLRRREQ